MVWKRQDARHGRQNKTQWKTLILGSECETIRGEAGRQRRLRRQGGETPSEVEDD